MWGAALLYAVLLTAQSIHRHDAYETSFDLAIYDQLVWLLAHGHDPFSTLVSRPMLGDHFSPSLVLLVPLYWAQLGVSGLLAAQSLGLALNAPALYGLARHAGAPPELSAVPALLWLVSPWTASANLFEFHPTTFAPVLLTLSVLAALRDQRALLAVTSVLALSLREDVAAAYLVLGLLIIWHGRRRLGAAVAAGSVAWAALAYLVIQSQSDSVAFFGKRFAGTRGDTVGDAVIWMANHPLQTVSDSVANSGTDVLLLLAATAGLALLAPSWMLLGVPTMLHNALTANVFQHDLVHHEHIVTAGGLFVAAALGVKRVEELRRSRVVLAVALQIAVFGMVVGLTQRAWFLGQPLERTNVSDGLAAIPAGASVAATIHLQPHLSQRREIYALPEPFIPWDWGSPLSKADLAKRAARLDYVAYYDGDGPLPYVQRVLPTLRRDGFVVVYQRGAMRVYKREGAKAPG